MTNLNLHIIGRSISSLLSGEPCGFMHEESGRPFITYSGDMEV